MFSLFLVMFIWSLCRIFFLIDVINPGYIFLGFPSKTSKRRREERNIEIRKIMKKKWKDGKESIFNDAAVWENIYDIYCENYYWACYML